MAEYKDLKVDELNFDLIKANFKNYLQAQDEFRDYNFEGSGINTLLDLLAYNTYYNGFYLNMASGEAYLSTAQKRNSVVALAKSLNYTPRSRTAATISGTITVTPTASPTSITIPKYTEFTGTIDGTTYTFLTRESKVVASSASYATTVTLVEGRLVTTRYTVSASDIDQRFLIPNTNVDTTTLSVRVLNSSTDSTTRSFIRAGNVVELESTDQVYFLEEAENGQFELRFGDGIFGVALDAGNIVVIDYIVTNGKDANGIQVLTYADSISGVTGITFTATASAAGGADRETISSIKFNAPKAYESQNRAVTTQDYVALVSQQPNVDSVVVWGGEDNDPPAYGVVYMAIKPTVGLILSALEKNNIINTVIKPKKILTVRTEIIDPDYVYLAITTNVNYNSETTILTSDQIKTSVIETIQAYNDAEINDFSKYFRYSQLSRLIDFSDRSILNNTLSVALKKEVDIQLGIPLRYEINFSNPISSITLGRPANHPYGAGNQVTSNSFTYNGETNCFLEDNNGIIRIYRVSGGENIAVLSSAGTIDYDTGKIILNAFTPTAFGDGGNTLKLTVTPSGKDILPLRNQILTIRDADITVNMIDDTTVNLITR